jgi:hypothetical protein
LVSSFWNIGFPDKDEWSKQFDSSTLETHNHFRTYEKRGLSAIGKKLVLQLDIPFDSRHDALMRMLSYTVVADIVRFQQSPGNGSG